MAFLGLFKSPEEKAAADEFNKRRMAEAQTSHAARGEAWNATQAGRMDEIRKQVLQEHADNGEASTDAGDIQEEVAKRYDAQYPLATEAENSEAPAMVDSSASHPLRGEAVPHISEESIQPTTGEGLADESDQQAA